MVEEVEFTYYDLDVIFKALLNREQMLRRFISDNSQEFADVLISAGDELDRAGLLWKRIKNLLDRMTLDQALTGTVGLSLAAQMDRSEREAEEARNQAGLR
jgi:hypothetical protein